jgi:15-hydroxyprostaglandin dehydrogenase (NAD)
MAPVVQDENVTINCFCPGFIDTGLTKRLLKTVPPQYITPMSTLLRAYDDILENDATGCAAEISRDQIYFRQAPEFADESQRWVTDYVGLPRSKVQA